MGNFFLCVMERRHYLVNIEMNIYSDQKLNFKNEGT